ncbi:MAG: DUF2513 domain-containing protein [Methylophilus sp.]|nr:DUF2513 domain-containing protein [Methylophilus sp.]
MVRDWELVRKILFTLEAKDSTHGQLASESIENYKPEVVSYHIYMMKEAGLIDAHCLNSANASIVCFASSLTWEGHEFLDKIRNENVWNKIKGHIKAKGLDLSFDVIKVVVTTIIGNMIP